MHIRSRRDRTTEFRYTVLSLKGRQMNSYGGNKTIVSQTGKQGSEFIKIARSIGQDITNTYNKLEKLTLLVKRKTIFDDKSLEIQKLTFIIKHDIDNLTRQIRQLQIIAK